MITPEQSFLRYRERGDVKALGEVFDAVAAELGIVAAHVAPLGVEPEDLVQATFVTAIESREHWDATRPLVPWLLGILVNHARRERQRESRRPEPDRLPQRETLGPLGEAELAEVGARIAEALRSLPRHHRQALTLRLVHGLTPTQIATALGCPVTTCKTRLQRGLAQLRRALPAGIGASLAAFLVSGKGLAAARQATLAKAAVPATAAATAGTTAVAIPAGLTLILMKQTLATAGAIALAVTAWFVWPQPPGAVAEAPASRTAHATAADPSAGTVQPAAARQLVDADEQKVTAGETRRVQDPGVPADGRAETRRGTRQAVVVVDAAGVPLPEASVYWASPAEMQQRMRSLGEAGRDLGASPVQALVRMGDCAHADEAGRAVLTTSAVPPIYVAAVTSRGWGLSAFTEFAEEPWRVVHEPHRVLRVALHGARGEDVPVILRWNAPADQTGLVNGLELGRVSSPGLLVRPDYEMVEAEVRKPRPDASDFGIALGIVGGTQVAAILDQKHQYDFQIPGPVRSLELDVIDGDGRVIESANGRVTIRHGDANLMWYSVRAGRALLPCAAVGKVAEVEFAFAGAPTWDAELQIPAQGRVVVVSRSHAVVTGRVICRDGPVPDRLELQWDGGSVVVASEAAGRIRATVPAKLTRVELLGGDRSAGVDLGTLDPSRTAELGVIVLSRHTTLSLSIETSDGAQVLDASVGVKVGHRVWKIEGAKGPVAVHARPGESVLVAIHAPRCAARRLELVAGAQDRTEVVVLDRAGSVRGRVLVPEGFGSDLRVALQSSDGELRAPDRAERTAEGFDVEWKSFPMGEAVAHLVSARPALQLLAVPVRVGGDAVNAFELDGRHIDLRRVVLQCRPTALAANVVVMRAQAAGHIDAERWMSGISGTTDEAFVLDASRTYVLLGPKCAASYLSGGVRSPHRVELRSPTPVRVSGADLAWHLWPRSDDFDLRKLCRRVHFVDGRVFRQPTSLGDIVGFEPRLLHFPCPHDVVVSGGSSQPETVALDGATDVVLRAN